MVDYKEISFIVVACILFIILYKRFLRRETDKPHKPAVIIISFMLLAGIYNAKRSFLEKHSSDIISIVVCLLSVLVFLDLYDSSEDERSSKQIFRIDSNGTITQY